MVRGLGNLGATAALGYLLFLRPWHLRWGATGSESRRPMRGDDLVRHPWVEATRAISIDAPVTEIWPWLVQLGDRRAPPSGPDNGLRIEAIEPNRLLVLASRLDDRVVVSNTLMLEPFSEKHSRLIVRLRAGFRPTPRELLYFLLLDPGDFFMARKMMRGIKQRAERAWALSSESRDPSFHPARATGNARTFYQPVHGEGG